MKHADSRARRKEIEKDLRRLSVTEVAKKYGLNAGYVSQIGTQHSAEIRAMAKRLSEEQGGD